MRRVLHRVRRYGEGFAARQAARRALPPWLKLLLPFTALACVFGTTFAIAWVAHELHRALHPGTPLFPVARGAEILMAFPAFLAALAPGLIAANLLLWLVPPLRRALDKNAKGVPDASFRQSVRSLGKGAAILVPIGLALVLLGAVEPWAR